MANKRPGGERKPARGRARARANAGTARPRGRSGRKSGSTVFTVKKQRVTARSRNNLKPWLPGQSGNPSGRPRGARNRLSEGFFVDFAAAWESKGPKVLAWTIKHDPVAFLRAAATLAPK